MDLMPITGDNDELIARLVWAIDQEPPSTEGWWYNAAVMLAAVLGGRLFTVVADTGLEYEPGTMGAEIRATRQVVSRAEYMETMRERLREIVRSGVAEDFLVASCRTHLDHFFDGAADFARNQERNASRVERLQRALDDPAELAALRSRSPGAPESDEELVAKVHRLLEVFSPPDADRASERLMEREGWHTVAAAINDEVIEEWQEHQLLRALRNDDDS